jgi:hypothetical protein
VGKHVRMVVLINQRNWDETTPLPTHEETGHDACQNEVQETACLPLQPAVLDYQDNETLLFLIYFMTMQASEIITSNGRMISE